MALPENLDKLKPPKWHSSDRTGRLDVDQTVAGKGEDARVGVDVSVAHGYTGGQMADGEALYDNHSTAVSATTFKQADKALTPDGRESRSKDPTMVARRQYAKDAREKVSEKARETDKGLEAASKMVAKKLSKDGHPDPRLTRDKTRAAVAAVLADPDQRRALAKAGLGDLMKRYQPMHRTAGVSKTYAKGRVDKATQEAIVDAITNKSHGSAGDFLKPFHFVELIFGQQSTHSSIQAHFPTNLFGNGILVPRKHYDS